VEILEIGDYGMKTPRHTLTRITAAIALLAAIATVAISEGYSDPAFSNIKISNFGQMDERFYRGARPKQRDFQALKDLGIQTVIDLTDNTPQEKGYVEALGMTYVNIAIPDKQDPTDAQIGQFLKLVNDPATGKFYVHCAGGRHRTGVMGAIYRLNNYRWNFNQAYTEMQNFDFYTSNGHGGQKRFVENYAQRIQSEIATQSAAQGSK
jgi:protein tyrosine/serine phosphatase